MIEVAPIGTTFSIQNNLYLINLFQTQKITFIGFENWLYWILISS